MHFPWRNAIGILGVYTAHWSLKHGLRVQMYRDSMLTLELCTTEEAGHIFGPIDHLIPVHQGKPHNIHSTPWFIIVTRTFTLFVLPLLDLNHKISQSLSTAEFHSATHDVHALYLCTCNYIYILRELHTSLLTFFKIFGG